MRVPLRLGAAIAAALMLVGACSSSSGSGGANPAPATRNPLSAAQVAEIHATGLPGLSANRLSLISQIGIISDSGLSWVEIISVDGANLPDIGLTQLASYVTVTEAYVRQRESFPVVLTEKGVSGIELDYSTGPEDGHHYVLISSDQSLFNQLHGSSSYGYGSLAYDGETLQSPGVTVSLLRALPSSNANHALMVDLAATELCNTTLHATTTAATASELPAKDAEYFRREGQEVMCNSIGVAAKDATARRLSYAVYLNSDASGTFPALVGNPQSLAVDQGAFDTFK